MIWSGWAPKARPSASMGVFMLILLVGLVTCSFAGLVVPPTLRILLSRKSAKALPKGQAIAFG